MNIKSDDIFIKCIGEGGFGYVDEVIISNHTQSCARKTLSTDKIDSQNDIFEIRKRFIQEVTLQSQLNHRNIVPIITYKLNSNPPQYYMPLAINSLHEDIQISKQLNENNLNALNDIALGLEYIHSQNIYHRDLKPQNILKFKDKQGFFYAISDFGLASVNDSNITRLTTTAMQKGSDFYSAPEIFKSLKYASAQSDIFSFGCILDDMIGNPFERIPGSKIEAQYDNPYHFILKTCTDRNPKRRFKKIKDVLTAILNISLQSISLDYQSDLNKILIALNKNLTNTPYFYENLFSYLKECDDSEKLQILFHINNDIINNLSFYDKSILNDIADYLSQWIEETSFTFAYCDTIANKLLLFYPLLPNTIKSCILISLLKMGTSHNRWYVERLFWKNFIEMDNGLTKAFNSLLYVKGKDIIEDFNHLSCSISIDLQSMNSETLNTLKQLNK